MLFNLYVNNLKNILDCPSFQYADDTTIYDHCLPQDFTATVYKMNDNISNLEDWATQSNLMLNGSKTKQMLITTPQMSTSHVLRDIVPTITANGEVLERTSYLKFSVHG